jgi:hypothetical protein
MPRHTYQTGKSLFEYLLCGHASSGDTSAVADERISAGEAM